MAAVRLLHLRPAEAAARIGALRALGHDVAFDPLDDRETLAKLWRQPPDVYLFDLTRVPSHMREVAIGLRERKTTRGIPLVFAGGEPDKVEALRALLPDAVYTAWDAVGGALALALAHPPSAPVVPESRFAGYSGTPLPKKLGIKPAMQVALRSAPEGLAQTLGALPEGAALAADSPGPSPLALCFVRTHDELASGLAWAETAVAEGGSVWLAWPKRTSGVATEVAQREVRREAMASGWVDYKVAAIDATWSGLCFTRRKPA